MRITARATGMALSALTAAGLLAGCGSELSPGVAAQVGKVAIAQSEVDELTEAQCLGVGAAVSQGQATEVPRSAVAAGALGVLIDIVGTEQFAEAEGISARPESVRQIFAQAEPLAELIPAERRTTFTDTYRRWAQTRDVLVQAGAETTGEKATEENTAALLDAGTQARDAYLADVGVETSDRYGPNKDGWPTKSGGSVSEPVSESAKGGSATEPAEAWISALPAIQKCG